VTPTGRGRRGLTALCLCVSAAIAVAGCTTSRPRSSPDAARGIVVGSFNFPESMLLADIYAGALRAGGFRSSVEAEAGPREIIDPALAGGIVDIVPEYTGSALLFFGVGSVPAGSREEQSHQALADVLLARGLIALTPAPGEDSNAIVVTEQTASRYGLHSLSDLGAVAGRLVFGGPPECPERPLCLLGLENVYGLRFRDFVPLDSGGPLTVQALLAGEVDVGLVFTTDPAITAEHLVVLADDRRLQPAENVIPVVRRAIAARYGPALENLIDRVSARLDTDVLRKLNRQVASGEDPSAVAARWLASWGKA